MTLTTQIIAQVQTRDQTNPLGRHDAANLIVFAAEWRQRRHVCCALAWPVLPAAADPIRKALSQGSGRYQGARTTAAAAAPAAARG
jgi:hypothetical protein